MAGTVTVACKHPNGLHLDLDTETGGKKRVTVRGYATPFGVAPHTVGGYALTEVDAAHWEAWFAKNKDSSLVKDQIIYAMPARKQAEARATEQEEVKPMSAPLDPDAIKGVEKADLADATA
jgi:hypothetical protein